MERPNAFQPKKRSIEASAPSPETGPEPLNDLETDTASVAVFQKVFDFVSSNTFNSNVQIDAYVNPRFSDTYSRDAYLLNAEGRIVEKAKGGAVTRKDVPTSLSPDQQTLFKRILSEKKFAALESRAAEDEITSLNKVFALIANNSLIRTSALDSINKARFSDTYSQDAYLLNAEGRIVEKAGGAALTRKELGTSIPVGAYEVLREILEQKINSRVQAEKAKSEITNFDLSSKLLLSNPDRAARVIGAIVDPRFSDAYSRDAYLLNAEGRIVEKGNGAAITRKEVGTGLSKEQASLLKEAGAIFADPKIAPEVKENLRRALEAGEDAMLKRMDAVMEMSADPDTRTRITGLLEKVGENRRSTKLRAEIYQGLVKDQSLTELSAKLADYEELDLGDRELVATLQDAIAAKRRFETFKAAEKPLAKSGRDIDDVLAKAQPLLTSKSEADQRAGILLVTSAYRVELAAFRKGAQDLIKNDVDPNEFRAYADSLPIRPSVGDFDYIATAVDVREKGFENIADIEKNRRLDTANKIRASFKNAPIEKVLEDIDGFPGETEEDIAIKKQLFTLYRSFVATNRPDDFDKEFATEIRARQEAAEKALFISPELGRNKEAFNYVRGRFVETIYPLIESLRADATTARTVKGFLENERPGGTSPRRRYEQRLAQFEKQRPLTDTERNYLQSVELLSVFNPYLVASVYADEGVTSAFLKHHFDTLSAKTLEDLNDGDYVPLVQIGTGPSGTAGLGEIARNNPELARQTLVVDAGKQPGGPFAIPEGAAWELNSANRRGAGGPALPDKPDEDELGTVRAYGSPLRWYPGERANERSTRQGSINVTVDYLPTPDDLSQARYPTNEELQTILALQNALLTERLALNTRVVKVSANPDVHAKGDKLVTLEVGGDTPRTLTIATDAIISATGLGDAGFGFKLEGSRAERVIEQTKDSNGFPKISRTLDAFKELAGRTGERSSPGETLVITGSGNSTDVLIEYIGSLFQGDNPLVRDVTKIYVIADGQLSSRPRYAQINDLKPRNGRGNLIEQISARVNDIDFADTQGDPQDRKLIFINQEGRQILNEDGEPIKADSAIAATGFRSQLDSVFEEYSKEKTEGAGDGIREPLALPTNPNVPVAETLKGDPTVLIVGTSSKPEFDKIDKLDQLPREAREALLRNGAENAVAIGFRAPDTQAAVNIWLNTQDITLEPVENTARASIEVGEGTQVPIGATSWLPTLVNSSALNIPNNIDNEFRLLSPLLSYNVGNKLEIKDSRKTSGNFTGEFEFELTSNPDQRLGLTFTGGSVDAIPQSLIDAVKDACADADFEKYAFVALQKKRRNQKIDLVLSFKDGKLDPSSTFVQS